MEKLRIATDCSGIETPLMALDQLKIPYDHIFSSETDRNCLCFIQRNFPPQHLYHDIKTRDNSLYQTDPMDLYIAGFPCQPFSSLGKKNGVLDEAQTTRNDGLFWHIRDFIKINQPKVFILENVKALKVRNKGKDLQLIIESLKSCGNYSIHHQIMNTSDYGIPQSRSRLYIVGFNQDWFGDAVTTFEFPAPHKQQFNIEHIVNPYLKAPPPLQLKQSHIPKLQYIQQKWPQYDINNPDQLWIIDLNRTNRWLRIGKPNLCPCIITHYQYYYVPRYQRYLTAREIGFFQGIIFHLYDFSSCSDKILFKMFGNAMSINVLIVLLNKIFHTIHKI